MMGITLSVMYARDPLLTSLTEKLRHNHCITEVSVWDEAISDPKQIAALCAALENSSVTTVVRDKRMKIEIASKFAIESVCAVRCAFFVVVCYPGLVSCRLLVFTSDINVETSSTISLSLSHLPFRFASAQANKFRTSDTIKSILENEVTSVCLPAKAFNDANLERLCDALSRNTSVTSVDLSDNRIGDAGCASLAELLRVNAHIQSINLYRNAIGPKGVAVLAAVLHSHPSLTQLFLGGNAITECVGAPRDLSPIDCLLLF